MPMGKLIVTVAEATNRAALARIAAFPAWIDGVELRADALSEPAELRQIADAVSGISIFTRRGGSDEFEVDAVLGAGFSFVDVDLMSSAARTMTALLRDRLIVSHHDFESFPDIRAVVSRIRATGALHGKLAVTPSNLQENLDLLRIAGETTDLALTVVGMGPRGLYSRVVAPAAGSEFAFVAASFDAVAAPGQITIDQAEPIYRSRSFSRPAVFAIAGNPAHHSRSPEIHNRAFGEAAVDAIYTFCEVESFEEAGFALLRAGRYEPVGISVTAPFKEDALRFARASGATLSANARDAGAVNTLFRIQHGKLFELVADNTDVDGFEAALEQLAIRPGMRCVVAGAGGTARAALVALRRGGVKAMVYNRSTDRGEELARELGVAVRPLSELRDASADVLVDTLPPGADIELPQFERSGGAVITAQYAEESTTAARARAAGLRVFDGSDLLRAQAVRQSRLFIRAARSASRG